MGFKERTNNFVNSIPTLEKTKAIKYIFLGLLLIIIFGLIAGISSSIANEAGNWKTMADNIAQLQLNEGIINNTQYNNIRISNWQIWHALQLQETILANIAKVGVDIGLILISMGFISFAVNENLDPRTRVISLILSGVILLVILFTTLFNSISLTIA
jgi:hypothetical protein